ncbi:glutamine synthetase/guanido kinase [Coemansia reversa NRRL 1564]|uniref:Glutamine synthetase/guanido kinase n=1 Tax=Coemansia reversa (strain ATCC 12441 / NRRL 1564) TaxID=763665 RepID=A0A2G5B9Q9_COERN|nr:glutamine synthetase/guanido kinase [Coemansia reversa NRRL 1564]|eukprot:PIA15756.1 glutamine synthetase/guanido kinase [Coemansia reversa NRRL 1564]
MSAYELRKSALVAAATTSGKREIEYPRKADGKPKYPSEIYGENVFTLKTMAKALPKPIFASFLKQRRGRQNLDKTTADSIAHAVRVWAMDRGATHYTHWFQPQTGTTAEKHDAFLSLLSNFTPGGEEVTPIDLFSGSQLLQSEPDASSFPSGGMRSTFEARGYTIWDTSSSMYVQRGPNGTSILYIPSVFISYNGDALDEKTGLLRSTEVLSRAACELVNLLEPEAHVGHVHTTLGTEQEFFLVDRAMYALRQDLKITGRTLVGQLPPRHQQLEDHYFGRIPSRVMRAISELELECLRLGIPIKTRHNEVAPAQFEVAPIFEEASVAVDHNLLTMDVLHKVAHRHNLRVLYHEKPFKGVNGSGKHCNWAIATDRGENLLDPTVRPETNYRFILFLLAVLRALQEHAPLLRLSISSSSNEHRLGAQEAPPGIISAFLGDQLNEVLDAIEEDRPLKNFSVPQFQSIKVGGTVLDVKVAGLPHIARDLTDRNRTSPFAFTGNKFEFRAVGSKQSPSFPVAVLNCAVTAAVREIADALREQMGSKPRLSDEDKLTVIRKYITLTKPVRFEGDNYSAEWVTEAERRGLPNIRSAPEAFAYLLKEKHMTMLTRTTGIFSEGELRSRYHILNERYAKDIIIEAETLKTIVGQQILPAAFEYRKSLAESAAALKTVAVDCDPEVEILEQLAPLVATLQKEYRVLVDVTAHIVADGESGEANAHAQAAYDQLVPVIARVRDAADELEATVADKYWPLPKYTELLLTI